MASDTVPAAVPGPGDPAGNPPATPPAPGGMAGLLAPVTPARFSIDPTGAIPADGAVPAGGQEADPALAGASSADFHNDPTTPTNGSSSTAGRGEQTSVVRAWLLAGAERWRKGADARNKRLEIQKARATALQVKEARTTTVNRSEKLVGGNTGSSTNTQAKSDKNTGSRTSGTGASGGTGNGGRGSAGNSGNANPKRDTHRNGNGNSGGGGKGGTGSHHGNGNGNTGGRGNGNGGRAPGNRNHTNGPDGSGTKHRDKQPRPDTGRPTPKNSGTDRSDKAHHGPTGPRHSRPDTTSSNGSGTGNGDTRTKRAPDTGHKNSARPSDTTTQTCGDASGIDRKQTKRKDRPHKTEQDTTGAIPKGSVVLDKQPKPATDPTSPKQDTGKAPSAKNTPAPKTTPRPAPGGINTQGAREAGYRDGTRVGTVIAQAGAYRDGAKDGLADTRQAAQAEKQRLDKAREDRRTGPHPQLRPPLPGDPETLQAARTPIPATPPEAATDMPPKPAQPPQTLEPAPHDTKPQPSTPSPAPQPAPTKDGTVTTPTQPVAVNRVGKTSIELGVGALRSTISHGEVRTLRAFQRRLKTKADGMTQVVEACAGLKAYAQQQLTKAIWWTEQARTIEGGEHLLGPLMKLEEAATIQVRKAEEIRKRAARAADSCRALSANVEIRYEPIYKAVCDSPHTKPAVLDYYREMANA